MNNFNGASRMKQMLSVELKPFFEQLIENKIIDNDEYIKKYETLIQSSL